MGKLLNQYMEKYHAAIALRPSQNVYLVRPEVWICATWEEENRITPWHPEYLQRLADLRKEDPELASIIQNGMLIMMGIKK